MAPGVRISLRFLEINFIESCFKMLIKTIGGTIESGFDDVGDLVGTIGQIQPIDTTKKNGLCLLCYKEQIPSNR